MGLSQPRRDAHRRGAHRPAAQEARPALVHPDRARRRLQGRGVTLRRRVFRYLAAAAVVSCALTVGVAVVLVRREVARQRLTALERQAELVSAVGGFPGALRPGEHVYWVNGRHTRRITRRRAALIIAGIPDLSQG